MFVCLSAVLPANNTIVLNIQPLFCNILILVGCLNKIYEMIQFAKSPNLISILIVITGSWSDFPDFSELIYLKLGRDKIVFPNRNLDTTTVPSF